MRIGQADRSTLNRCALNICGTRQQSAMVGLLPRKDIQSAPVVQSLYQALRRVNKDKVGAIVGLIFPTC